MKEFWLNVLQKLKRPRGWGLFLLYFFTVLACAGAITFAVLGAKHVALEIFSYVFYGVAAITLGFSVYTIVIYAPTMKQSITAWIKKFAIGRRLLENYGFRTVLFAGFSTVLNIAYVVFHIVLAAIDRPFWYGSLAAYYGMLVALRGGIVLYQRKKYKKGGNDEALQRRTELHKYRTCGILLTVIPLCLVIPILQIIFLDQAFVHMGWTVFAFAAYAFYKIIMASYNIIKSRKQTDFTVQAVRCVGFADALVSIFSLQTALLFAFAEGGNYAFANVATGGAVCILTIALGVLMIVNAQKQIRQNKQAIQNTREEL